MCTSSHSGKPTNVASSYTPCSANSYGHSLPSSFPFFLFPLSLLPSYFLSPFSSTPVYFCFLNFPLTLHVALLFDEHPSHHPAPALPPPSAILTPPHSSHLQHSLYLSQKQVTSGSPRFPPRPCRKPWGWASLPPASHCQVFPLHHPKDQNQKGNIIFKL